MKRAKKRQTRKPRASKIAATTPEIAINDGGLVGRYFHIFDDDGNIQFQGRVAKRLDDTHFLVQFYAVFSGTPNTLHVVTIDTMTSAPDFKRMGGHWQFYEDHHHWVTWYEDHPNREVGQPDHTGTGNGGNPAQATG